MAGCLLLVLLSALSAGVLAQEAVSEAELKAAFLYNFTKFVEWPPEALDKNKASFVIGIFGEKEFSAALGKALAGKKAHGRPIVARKLSNEKEAADCQIVFFREPEEKRWTRIFHSIRTLPVLTVGESGQFLNGDGIFNLVFEDKQLRFEVNATAAERAGLSVTSKLLRLARKVKGGGGK